MYNARSNFFLCINHGYAVTILYLFSYSDNSTYCFGYLSLSSLEVFSSFLLAEV